MLAGTYAPDRIAYPVRVQPKLDGVRMVAIATSLPGHGPGTGVKLRTRNGNDLGHLAKLFQDDILNILKRLDGDAVLDGELYAPQGGFQSTVSLVKSRSMADTDRQGLEYHVFDVCMNSNAPFVDRERALRTAFRSARTGSRLRLVSSRIASSESEVNRMLEEYVKQGYEGIIIRSPGGLYQPGKRSSGMWKLKRFQDAEFEIVRVLEASGKDAGTPVFECKTRTGRSFRARPQGSLQQRRHMFRQRSQLIGRQLTVRFQELTDDGVPRFPVALAVRDYE